MAVGISKYVICIISYLVFLATAPAVAPHTQKNSSAVHGTEREMVPLNRQANPSSQNQSWPGTNMNNVVKSNTAAVSAYLDALQPTFDDFLSKCVANIDDENIEIKNTYRNLTAALRNYGNSKIEVGLETQLIVDASVKYIKLVYDNEPPPAEHFWRDFMASIISDFCWPHKLKKKYTPSLVGYTIHGSLSEKEFKELQTGSLLFLVTTKLFRTSITSRKDTFIWSTLKFIYDNLQNIQYVQGEPHSRDSS